MRNAPPGTESGPPRTTTTLESGATVLATPAAKALQDYLDSGEPAGRRFRLQEIRFVGGEQVREDPDGSIATLSAILRGHPAARVRIEVARPTPQRTTPDSETERLAREVAEAFVRNGVPPAQITSAGALTEADVEPLVFMVVIAK